MNLGISVRRFGPFGGMEKVAFGFVKWLVSRGHCVEVWSNEFVEHLPNVLPRKLGAGGRGVLWKARSLASAVSRIPTGNVDGFLHFERGGLTGVYRAGAGCHAAFRSRCGGGLFGPVLEAIDRKTCLADRPLIVNSELVASEMEEFYGVDRERIHLVRNGVDLDKFKPEERAKELTVAFVGSDARRKGLYTAMKAVAMIDGVRLQVLGNVPGVARRWAKSLGILQRVQFMGWLERPETVLCRSHAMLLPSCYDPSSNAALEALASGVPVVTSRFNGAAEITPAPWLVLDDCWDAEGYAEVLLRAMKDPTLPMACRSVAESHDANASYSALLKVMLEG